MKTTLTKLILISSLIVFTNSLESELLPHDEYNSINPFTKDCPYDPHQVVTTFSVKMAMYYSWFASYARCRDEIISSGQCCVTRPPFLNWELIDHNFAQFNFKADDYESNYVIFKSDEYKKYVISFPSTRGGLGQMIEEVLYSELIPIDDSPILVVDYVHYWLNKIKDMLYSEKNLKEFRAHPDYQIIYTGHSLGAATAMMAVFREQYYPELSFKNNYKPVIVTMGGFRIGNGDLVDFIEPKADIYRVLRKYDSVGLFPPCGLSILTSDYCEKTHENHVHPGRYYLIDENQEYIYYCDVEYVQPSDPKCINVLDGSHYDPTIHTNYFSDENLSRRCINE